MSSTANIKQAELQLRILTVLLTVQFILGALLTTVINYEPTKHDALQLVFLVLHIIVAAGLLVTAVIRLITSLRWRSLLIHSTVGLLSIVGAMVAGGIAAANGNSAAVFIMALGFLFAFGAYGYSMSALRNLRSVPPNQKAEH